MAKRKSVSNRKKAQKEIEFLESALHANGGAILEGPKKKRWTKHDIRNIRALTETQEKFFQSFFQGSEICAYGSAGTGKSFVALYLALNEILDGRFQDRIVIIRSAVNVREQGHLPGTQEEKNAPFENPYRDILENLFGRASTYNDMKEAGLIQFMTTAHLRGLTWDNAIVIIDEAQNMNISEISTAITRLGEKSRIMILGDYKQNDLIRKNNDISGFFQLISIVSKMDSFSKIEFTVNDIVRGRIVKEWIVACEELKITF